MYLIFHALKNIGRNKGRYLLIGAVLMISLAAITASAMIHFTAEAVIDGYSDSFGAKVTFTPDLRKLIALTQPDENGFYYNPEITTEQYLAFSRSSAVKSTLFRGARHTYSSQLIGLDQGGEENYYDSGGDALFQGSSQAAHDVRRQAPNTLVLGYSDASMIEDFPLGLRELEEGRFFEQPGECIISRDFANLNGVKIGDHLELQDVNNIEVAPLSLTVCGIYLDITIPQPDGSDWAVNNRRNEILTSFATFEEHSMQGLFLFAEYYLENPELASEFEKYVRQNGLSEIYNVNVDAENYNRIVKPVEGLKNISTTFLAVILLVGCLTLILLSMLGVRERRYEIGVLRAIGMPKSKVAFGLICESLCVFALCLCIGFGAGCLIAQPVSNAILVEQGSLSNWQTEENYGALFGDTAKISEPALALQELEITLSPESIALIAVLSLILCLLTNIAGIYYITKYEPMKILSERG